MTNGESFEDRVTNALWRGNGQKPLVERVGITESEIAGMKDALDRMNRNLNKIALLLLGVLATIVGEIIVRGIK